MIPQSESLENMSFTQDIADLDIFAKAMQCGRVAWGVARTFDHRLYDTIGRQLIRSADSIAANISEGFGRFHYKDKARFCYIARGSLQETIVWLDKALERNCISQEQHDELAGELIELRKMLNGYINSMSRRNK